jgi:hypothetical protein
MEILNFNSFLEIKSLNEAEVFTDFDKKWDYKKDGKNWYTKKKGSKDWIDITNRKEAVDKLNKRYFPDQKLGSKETKSSKKISLNFDDPSSAIKSDSFEPYRKEAQDKQKKAENVIIDQTKKVASESLKKDVVKTTSGLKTVIPVHMRAYLNFLNLRKDPFTQADLTKSEIQSILSMIEMRKMQKKFSSGQNFDFYNASNDLVKKKGGSEKIDFSDKKLGFNQANVTEDSTKIALTLGNAKVTEKPNSYIIEDIYDFNNYYKHPEKYTLKALPSTIAKALGQILTSNSVQGLESLSSIFHKFGYKGFPVKIEIPKKNS